MGKSRLEAFSDGVIAIIITIMVLELHKPDDVSLASLMGLAPHLAIYALSFLYVGIYWNNHHHMFHAVRGVNGGILWANLHLLFWLSLVPLASAWMGESNFASVPVAMYGVLLLLCGFAYYILARLLLKREGQGSVLARALGHDGKTLGSLAAYIIAIIAAPFYVPLSLGLYAGVACLWLIPDRRIENVLQG